ncbi:hypothetical protein GCM10009527_019570 [Actinomadura nitritigenes]
MPRRDLHLRSGTLGQRTVRAYRVTTRLRHVRLLHNTRYAERGLVGSVIKKRRKRMAKKKHRKLLKKTRIQRRNKK